jgi:ABC-2 type transport system ATP-binding protein
VVGGDSAGLLLDLEPTADDQVVLAAARGAGPVRAFTPLQPTLTELFREVVGA